LIHRKDQKRSQTIITRIKGGESTGPPNGKKQTTAKKKVVLPGKCDSPQEQKRLIAPKISGSSGPACKKQESDWSHRLVLKTAREQLGGPSSRKKENPNWAVNFSGSKKNSWWYRQTTSVTGPTPSVVAPHEKKKRIATASNQKRGVRNKQRMKHD